MCYKDGKVLIGWQTNNGKNYCFDSKGGTYANSRMQKRLILFLQMIPD